MKRLNFLYLSFVSTFLMATIGCRHEAGLHGSLSDYLKNKHDLTLSNSIKNVIVLTENDCVNCNKTLDNFLSTYLGKINYENTLIIVNASGAKIDISYYPLNTNKIVFDDTPFSRDFPFLNNTAYIKFGDDGKVDTIIKINSEEIVAKLVYIKDNIIQNTNQTH